MSVRYTVVNCERVLPVVDNEDYDELNEFFEQNFPMPRGTKEKNHTIAVRVCRNRTVTDSATGRENMSSDTERQNRTHVCEIRYIPVKREKRSGCVITGRYSTGYFGSTGRGDGRKFIGTSKKVPP